jgi:hypothetical protein
LTAASLVLHAGAPQQTEASQIQLQLANEFFTRGALRRLVDASPFPGARIPIQRAIHAGLIQASLRLALFDTAKKEADELLRIAPTDPATLALVGDAMWSAGSFEEAERRYLEAAWRPPTWPARITGSRARCRRAVSSTPRRRKPQTALRLAPRDGEIHHTSA